MLDFKCIVCHMDLNRLGPFFKKRRYIMAEKVQETDVIILGVGTCGEDLSYQLLDAGLEVVGIEPALIGGECAYWACLPSKMILRSAHALQQARRVNSLAGRAEVVADWEPLKERVRWLTGNWDDSFAVERYTKRKGVLVRGYGKLVAPRTVAVGDDIYRARKGVVIATGSRPFVPPVPGLSDVDYWTTHEFMQMETVPRSITVLGGGASGCELAQVLARFGSEVTIVEAGGRILSTEEPEASRVLHETFEEEGIAVLIGQRVSGVRSSNGSIVVTMSEGGEVSSERLLVVTGRTIDLSGLGLESVGLDGSARYIEVDEQMRVADGLWAMGDVTGKALFTHTALYQSAVVASDIVGRGHQPARYDALPRAIFTDPEVGSVGLTEAQARKKDLEIAVAVKQLSATFRGMVHGVEKGFVKLIADRKSGVLIGATVVGPDCAEVLGMLNLAVHARVPVETLQSMIYAFPAFYSAVGEALGAYGRGLTTVLDPGYRGAGELDSAAGRC